MDRFSSFESGTARGGSMSSGAAAATAVARAKPDTFQFPGEDGGRSLSAWARRDLEATLQLLADRAQYITGGSGAAIALRDGEHIICRASSGPSAPEVGSYLQVSSGLSGESVRTRKILSCDNAAMDPRVNRDSCRALGIASFVVMPLVRDDEVVGIFEIFSAKPHAFQERDIQALERMGEMVNTALDQVMNPKFKSGAGTGSTQKVPLQPRRAEAAAILPEAPAVATESSVPKPAIGTAQNDPQVRAEPVPVHQQQPHAPAAAPTTTVAPVDGASKLTPAVGTCASCGFPVSPGRAFCLDCEASLPEKFAKPAAGPVADGPSFLTDLSDGGPQPEGLKQWIVAHRYLLGTILVLGGTAALLLFH
jgi:hypothetical protein